MCPLLAYALASSYPLHFVVCILVHVIEISFTVKGIVCAIKTELLSVCQAALGSRSETSLTKR